MVTWSLAAGGWPKPDGEKHSGVPEGHFRLKHRLTGKEGAKMLVSLPLGPIFTSPSTVTPAARVSGPPALRTTSWDAPWKSTWTLSRIVSLFSCLGGGFDLQEAGVYLSARSRKTSGFPDLWKHWNSAKVRGHSDEDTNYWSVENAASFKDLSPTSNGGETL